MVNTFTMNIDVREYLRINPISVHELTLSGEGKDCFLLFPAKGYLVVTQDTLFVEIYKSIFGSLLGNDNKFNIRWEGNAFIWNEGTQLNDRQFKNYVKRATWNDFKDGYTGYDGKLSTLLNSIN